eukprot:PhF_6_TR25504/c2_g3_i5/m.35562
MSTISQSLSNANLQSTLTLYKLVNASVTDPTSNIVLGPYSILQAMALVDLCALDTTRDEIRNAFGWNASDLTNDNLHSSWKSLLGAMRTSARKGYQMKSANQISAFGWNASDLTIDNLHSSWKSLLGAMRTSASKGYQMKSA